MKLPVKTQAEKRAERLAKALRANLGRRKSQSRGRDAAPAPASDAGQGPETAEGAETMPSDAKMPQGGTE